MNEIAREPYGLVPADVLGEWLSQRSRAPRRVAVAKRSRSRRHLLWRRFARRVLAADSEQVSLFVTAGLGLLLVLRILAG